MYYNGFAYDTAGLGRQLRQCQHFASAKVGSVSVRISRGQWRRHYVFIRCTKFSINLGNLMLAECDPLYYMRCWELAVGFL